ncbi:MAG: HD domain-containing protein [Acidimicrobiales bacterium]
MAAAAHLIVRFFSSLWPFAPTAQSLTWVGEQLCDAEMALWTAASKPDQRHSVKVARDVVARLDGDDRAPREVLAAALLHDIGKNVSGLGTYTRVAATLSAAVAGRETAELWVSGSGITRRIGQYLLHPSLGGDLLEMAGSHPLTVAWAREHHLPSEQWSVDPRFAAALDAADND